MAPAPRHLFVTGMATLLLILTAAAAPAPAQDAPAAEAPAQEAPAAEAPAVGDIAIQEAKPGFELVVMGVMQGVERERFREAVLNALPPELTDPDVNFTNDDAYRENRSYRLVILFHREGSDTVKPENLCVRPEQVAAEPPSHPQDLMAATSVEGAFCEGEEALSTASDRMLGSVAPESAGFRFLVGDVAKQLFPAGFSTVPVTPITAGN